MLLMFKVKNYLSFKEETVLDMRATSLKQHPSHVINNSKAKLLKCVSIYGANASGKSNLISAMHFFEWYIFSQFLRKDKNVDFDSLENRMRIGLEPFLLSKDKNEISEFEIIFVHNDKEIQYGFECTSEKVLSEWLYIENKKVYKRSNTTLSFGTNYRNMLNSYRKPRPENILYLAVLEHFLEKKPKEEILGDFISFFQKEYRVFFEFTIESSVKGIGGAIHIHKRLIKDVEFRKRIENYLKSIDVGIKGLEIKTITEIDKNTGKKEEDVEVFTIHEVYDQNKEITGKKEFPLLKESAGTIRFLSHIQIIDQIISEGGVFIVDEMSAKLHPLLSKLIIELFCSGKNERAQLIFTTHDISLLNKNQFRRDEVVFIEKNERGESSLVALSDMKVREDATFNKDYIQGKYGAIPVFDYKTLMEFF